MTRTIHGHAVRTERVDGFERQKQYRVFADGCFCGLVVEDGGCGYHVVPKHLVGRVAPPVLHTPTCMSALEALVAGVFPDE